MWNDSKCYTKCNESREIFGGWGWGDVVHNHDEESEASLNRKTLHNSVKRKAMGDLYEIPRKLIHKELLSQDLDILTYEDIQNITRNMHKARSAQMLPITTNIAESHEALNAVQMLTSSQEQLLLIHGSEKKYRNVSLQTNLEYLSSIDVLSVDGTFKSAPSFTTNYLQVMDSATITMCHLHFSSWSINVKRPMMMCSDTEYQRLQHLM